jgi:uncharacterized RDD family membrane protein YckC
MSDMIRIQTPESVDLAYEPVGLGSRFQAALLDGLIQAAALLVIVLLSVATGVLSELADLELLGNIAIAILLLLVGLLFGVYKMLFEAIWNGQTPGKRLAGIRVVRANGLPVTFLQVVIRNLLRIIDYLPGWYALGALCLLFSKRHQRLGDLAAGTVVVRDRKAAAPVVPVSLNREPSVDLERLTEHARRLAETDLAPVRSFLQRRAQIQAEHRLRIAWQLADSLATKMGWQERFSQPESFLEEILFVRAKG